jgi:signal peptidase I
LVQFLREWVKPVLLVVVVLGAFRSAVANWHDVPTGSMKPTILEGDRIFVNQLAYDLRLPFTKWRLARWDGPQRGDIVVCHSPVDGKRLVKRVVGIPGDVVAMRDNYLLINGRPLEYRPLESQGFEQLGARDRLRGRFAAERLNDVTHPIMLIPARPAPRSFEPITVPAGAYFVLGDNRDESSDSRWFGFVERDDVMGRSIAVLFSLDHDHYHLPRWDRFFHLLK